MDLPIESCANRGCPCAEPSGLVLFGRRLCPCSLAYAEDPGSCTNTPDIEFQGQIWYSFNTIFESWAEVGGMSGTFTVEGDVGTFVGDDGGVIVYQRLDASGFREMQCSLGYTPG